jgi:hypothetical protein
LPALLAGPIDGAPLVQPIEAIVIGVLLVWMVLTDPSILTRRLTRGVIVALLAWQALTSALVSQDG